LAMTGIGIEDGNQLPAIAPESVELDINLG